MQHLSTDLETALNFVIERITAEAERSGAALSDDDLYFLRHLPTEPTNLTIHQGHWPDSSVPVVRDFSYETLCALARNARLHDVRTRPEAALDWEFSATVFQLEHHPMSWLLGWAGMKKRRPRWDGLLLVGTALLVVLVGIFGAITLSVFAEGLQEAGRRTLLIASGCVYVVIVILLYVGVQRLEKRRLKQVVEKYKSDGTLSPVGGSNR
jgi:hypothetical protein